MQERWLPKAPLAAVNHNPWRALERRWQVVPESFAPVCPLILVLDANAAIADVLQMTRRRERGTLTELRRAIMDRSVIMFAPTAIRDELRERLPGIVAKQRLPLQRALQEWTELQRMLVILNCLEPHRVRTIMDPDDVPYVALCRELSADGVCTADKHIAEMGGLAIHPNVVRDWTAYGRRAAQVYPARQGLALGGLVAFGLGTATMKGVATAWKSFPPWAKVAVVTISAAAALAIARSRASKHQVLLEHPQSATKSMLSRFCEWFVDSNADLSTARARLSVPTHQRTARGAAVAALGMERKPLSESDLVSTMEALGYRAQGRTSRTHLQRVLRDSPDFERQSDGRWTLSLARIGELNDSADWHLGPF